MIGWLDEGASKTNYLIKVYPVVPACCVAGTVLLLYGAAMFAFERGLSHSLVASRTNFCRSQPIDRRTGNH